MTNDAATYRLRWTNGQEYGPATMAMLTQWAREGRVPGDATLVPTDGSPPRAVRDEPTLAAILKAPPTVSTGPPPPADGAMAGMIPYKNPPALVGYYLSIFALLPFIGIVFGVPAFICGLVGLRKRLREPKVRGLAHAWIAIILGGLLSLVWGIVIVLMIVKANQGGRH